MTLPKKWVAGLPPQHQQWAKLLTWTPRPIPHVSGEQ